MGLAEDVTNAMLEVAMLAHDVGKTSPDSILFKNEIHKMREDGNVLFQNARKFDSILQNNPITGLPKHYIDDIQREIQLIRNNVISLRDILIVTKSYASNIENPSRLQCTYSSSEGYQSPSKLANSSLDMTKTPQRNEPVTPSSYTSSSCSCFDCNQSGLNLNWTPVTSRSNCLVGHTLQSSLFPETMSSGSGCLNDSESDESLYPVSPASSTVSNIWF